MLEIDVHDLQDFVLKTHPTVPQSEEPSDQVTAILKTYLDSKRPRGGPVFIVAGRIVLVVFFVVELRKDERLQAIVVDLDFPQTLGADRQTAVRQFFDDALDARALRSAGARVPTKEDDVLLHIHRLEPPHELRPRLGVVEQSAGAAVEPRLGDQRGDRRERHLDGARGPLGDYSLGDQPQTVVVALVVRAGPAGDPRTESVAAPEKDHPGLLQGAGAPGREAQKQRFAHGPLPLSERDQIAVADPAQLKPRERTGLQHQTAGRILELDAHTWIGSLRRPLRGSR